MFTTLAIFAFTIALTVFAVGFWMVFELGIMQGAWVFIPAGLLLYLVAAVLTYVGVVLGE